MGISAHGRGDTRSGSPEIFTDDEPGLPVHRPPVAAPRTAGPVAVPASAVMPVGLGDEDDDLRNPVPAPKGISLAADPWSDVHPELAALPAVAQPAPAGTTPKPERPVLIPAIFDDSPRPENDTDPEPTTLDCGGGWTIPMLCAGIAVIAACVLVPLAEENHQLVYQRERLKLDLIQVKKQVSVNDEFLKRINGDPMLAERLAQRQMKTIRQGEAVLDLPSNGREEMSPFMLVTVPPPTPMPAYRPVGGVLAAATRYPRTRLLLLGGGLFLVMFGLVLGYSKD